MKGISHFASGVTAASFLPWSVHAALEGNPLYFVLGGLFGLLPDTLDFKFYRFFYRHDLYIEPRADHLDPQEIADQIAGAVARAHTEKRTVRIKLSTIRVGGDLWQQYLVRFDEKSQEIKVQLGPVVNTGQVPVPGSQPKERVIGRAKLACPIVQTYETTTRVDIFDGPSFALEPDQAGRVILHFLPWHRNWSHSLIVGAAWALLGWLLWNWQAALTIFAGYSVHVLEDQLGHMGSNLFFPIRIGNRSPGLHWMHSGDSLPNFSAVWGSCLLIFWNLYFYNPEKHFHFSFWQLLLYGAIIPMSLYGLALYWVNRGREPETSGEQSDEWGDDPMLS